MKTKEEVIKEAWGSVYSSVKEYLNEHGQIHTDDVNFDVFEKVMLMCLYDSNTELLTNKWLQGIENNNGWIRIESEANLPKEVGYYLVYNGTNTLIIELNSISFKSKLIEQFKKDGFTHYQPIVKPNKPLY